MIRPPFRPAPAALAAAAATALWLMPAAPLAAQQTFDLPPASPSPSGTPAPVPAGPADERAGVEIPPRAAPAPAPSSGAVPVIQPLPSPGPAEPPLRLPAARRTPPPVTAPATGPASPADPAAAAPDAGLAPGSGPLDLPTGAAPVAEPPVPPAETFSDSTTPVQWPQWWPLAAGGLGALALLGGGAVLWRRRKPRDLRLAAPLAAAAPVAAAAPQEPPRLDLTLEITAATRSLMMFTLEYRLVIANRSARAVNDARVAVQLACARASGGAGPSAGAAQGLADAGRIGPHQARTVTGTVQLPTSAIMPVRQGQVPLFIPLVHVTLEGESLPAMARTFVVGMPSTLRGASGRVHPIALDGPPGSIAGLVAQAIALPQVAAAA